MSKMVKSKIDLQNSPFLTNRQKAKLKAAAERLDGEIDCSDISPLQDEFFINIIQDPFYKPKKVLVTLSIDADVLAFFIKQGKGCQKRINAISRGDDKRIKCQ